MHDHSVFWDCMMMKYHIPPKCAHGTASITSLQSGIANFIDERVTWRKWQDRDEYDLLKITPCEIIQFRESQCYRLQMPGKQICVVMHEPTNVHPIIIKSNYTVSIVFSMQSVHRACDWSVKSWNDFVRSDSSTPRPSPPTPSDAYIGSGNGLPPARSQTVTWTNAGLLFIGLFGNEF